MMRALLVSAQSVPHGAMRASQYADQALSSSVRENDSRDSLFLS
jgi:hypothetical protein